MLEVASGRLLPVVPVVPARCAAGRPAAGPAINRAGHDEVGKHRRRAAGAAGEAEIDRLARRDIGVPSSRLHDVSIAGVAEIDPFQIEEIWPSKVNCTFQL